MSKKTLRELIKSSDVLERENREDVLDRTLPNSFVRGTDQPTAVDRGEWLKLARAGRIVDTIPKEAPKHSASGIESALADSLTRDENQFIHGGKGAILNDILDDKAPLRERKSPWALACRNTEVLEGYDKVLKSSFDGGTDRQVDGSVVRVEEVYDGKDIFAAAKGEILSITEECGSEFVGCAVKIGHSTHNGVIYTVYTGLCPDTILVGKGDHVDMGQLIGSSLTLGGDFICKDLNGLHYDDEYSYFEEGRETCPSYNNARVDGLKPCSETYIWVREGLILLDKGKHIDSIGSERRALRDIQRAATGVRGWILPLAVAMSIALEDSLGEEVPDVSGPDNEGKGSVASKGEFSRDQLESAELVFGGRSQAENFGRYVGGHYNGGHRGDVDIHSFSRNHVAELIVRDAGRDRFLGLDDHYGLAAGSGYDTLAGSSGDDILRGGGGLDLMMAQLSSDVFVFGCGIGSDVIRNFERGQDLIEIDCGARSFGDLTITRSGPDVVIEFMGVDLTAETATGNQFDESDFVF